MRARQRHFKPKSAGASIAFDSRYISGVSDGSTVQTWSDLSGNGRDASQATAGARATYKTAIQGGCPVLRFDGGDHYTASFVTGTAYSVYAVAKRSGSVSNPFGNATFILGAGVAANTTETRYHIAYVDDSGGLFQLYAENLVTTTTPRNDSFNVHSGSSAIGSGDQKQFLNGANENTASVAGLDGVTSGTVRFVIAATPWDAAYQLIGDIGLIQAYEAAHSAPLRRRLEQSAAYSFKIACS